MADSPSSSQEFIIDSILENSSNPDRDKILLQPFSYLMQVPGKMVRGQLAQAFNYWMKIPEDKLNAISEIILMLHNASLLIDDIQDSSVLRRGIPVAHSIYGIPSTINAANYVYFLGLSKTLALNHPQSTNVFCEQLLELHIGQGMELNWRDSFTCPSETDYKEMTVRKTGGLFGLAVRLMQLFSESKQEFKTLTDILGLYFQIRDDYANLWIEEYRENKSYCEDLTEGKFSFPIIHAINTRPQDKQVINIIRQRPKDIEVKRYCLSLLEKYGSFEYTRKKLDELHLEAQQEIKKLGGNPLLMQLLDELKNKIQ